MDDLSGYVKKYRDFFFNNIGIDINGKATPCKYYDGNEACTRSNGCYCKKLAEVRGSIDFYIPNEYRNLSINNLTGCITVHGVSKEVWSKRNKKQIQATLREYLFDGASQEDTADREGCNKHSVLDKRYSNCENIIIHGESIREEKNGMPTRPLPSGKTLIACLILKEAIWRKIYNKSQSDAYGFVSYQNLRHELKTKSETVQHYKDADWLLIDDVSLPLNENNFEHQEIIDAFDDLLMTRMSNRLPTILVCEFDALKIDYTTQMGYSFQKIISLRNTWFVRVGDHSDNE